MEGKRPNSLCPACRANASQGLAMEKRTLCFQCYRDELNRERTLREAGKRDTGSVSRFLFLSPFEPVDGSRLESLRTERARAREIAMRGSGRYAVKRHRAQITARRALGHTVGLPSARNRVPPARHQLALAVADGNRAVTTELPESWLPFVVAR